MFIRPNGEPNGQSSTINRQAKAIRRHNLYDNKLKPKTLSQRPNRV